MRTCIVSIFLIYVAHCFAVRVLIDLRQEHKSTGEGRGDNVFISEPDPRGKPTIIAKDIPIFTKPSTLTKGELQQIAKEAVKLLKVKCNSIKFDPLDAFYNYVSTILPPPESYLSSDAAEITYDIKECAKKKNKEAGTSYVNPESFWTYFMSPYRKAWESKPDNTGSGIKVVNDSDSTTITFPAQVGYVIPHLDTVIYVQDKNPSEAKTWTPFNWLGDSFDSLKDFFSKIFGSDEGSSRNKRGVSIQSSHDADDNDPIEKVVSRIAFAQMSGKNAFIYFIDNVSRIYCHQCGNADDFKAAMKHLLELIIEDKSGCDRFAKQNFDTAFLQTLHDC